MIHIQFEWDINLSQLWVKQSVQRSITRVFYWSGSFTWNIFILLLVQHCSNKPIIFRFRIRSGTYSGQMKIWMHDKHISNALFNCNKFNMHCNKPLYFWGIKLQKCSIRSNLLSKTFFKLLYHHDSSWSERENQLINIMLSYCYLQ